MADNFNLRQFLTENKLTRNAKLLKEQEELSYPFGEFGQAVKDIFEHYNEEAISDAPDIVYEMIAELIEEYDLDTMSGEIDTDPMEARLLELYKAAQTMDTEKFGEFAYNELSDGSLFIGGDEDDDLDETSKYDPDNEEWEAEDDYSGQTRYVSRRDIEEEKKQASSGDMAYTKKAEKRVSEGDWRNNPYTSHNFDGVAAEAKKHKHLMKIANELFPQYGGNLENFKPLSPLERQQVYRQYTDDTKVIPFKESKLTAKERRLVEMVQDALGMAPQAVAEDEMVKQKALPKYENIEKLMQEIEHGTNEAAYKHKMAKMKEVAEMLEARVGSLEEGDGAEFVDTKKVKQMKKDIMTLRKQAEKLEKEYDKKFAKKEGKKETVKESKMQNFDLKKFLVENKITTNSRMLKEEFAPSSSPVKGIEDATYSVQEAFRKAGVDMTRPVTVIHSEQDRPYQKDPVVLAKDLERLKQDFMEEYEEGDDFPVFYEYDNNTVLADEMPEGKNYKLAVVFFEAEDFSILQ